MDVKQIRGKVISSIWQSIIQSDVDLTTIQHDRQEKMVENIADGVMKMINSILDEEMDDEFNLAENDELSEQLIWKGRPFLSLAENYAITSERLKIIKGVLSRDVENFELVRMQDIDYKQGVVERILGVGDITIRGHDVSDPEIILRNVSHPEDVYEILRKAWLDARKRHGLEFREFM